MWKIYLLKYLYNRIILVFYYYSPDNNNCDNYHSAIIMPQYWKARFFSKPHINPIRNQIDEGIRLGYITLTPKILPHLVACQLECYEAIGVFVSCSRPFSKWDFARLRFFPSQAWVFLAQATLFMPNKSSSLSNNQLLLWLSVSQLLRLGWSSSNSFCSLKYLRK